MIRETRGVYYDEVHHAACESAKEVMLAAKNAYWRFGGSATPWREDGAEKMIQALFASHIVNITASWLIARNYLVRPYILNVRVRDGRGNAPAVMAIAELEVYER